jgi:hypothetical protein
MTVAIVFRHHSLLFTSSLTQTICRARNAAICESSLASGYRLLARLHHPFKSLPRYVTTTGSEVLSTATKAVTVPNCACTTSGRKERTKPRNLRHSLTTVSGAVRDANMKVSVTTPAAQIGAFCLRTKGIDALPSA